jgi:ribonuclease P protein component
VALPKTYRLKRRRDFDRVYRFGTRKRAVHLHLVAFRLRQMPEGSLFGISISKKVSKRAVVRNRIKRRLKAALRQLLPRIKGGFWVVLVVRNEATLCDYWQLLRELEQLLVAAQVIHGD